MLADLVTPSTLVRRRLVCACSQPRDLESEDTRRSGRRTGEGWVVDRSMQCWTVGELDSVAQVLFDGCLDHIYPRFGASARLGSTGNAVIEGNGSL